MGIAHDLYSDFLQDVVINRVFSPEELTRGEGPLDEGRRREIEREQRLDTRSPALALVSGKGGWSSNPAKRGSYAVFTMSPCSITSSASCAARCSSPRWI